VEDPTDGSRVALGFEPVRGTRTVGIAGTMWLDRETGEVRVVEYAYRDPAGSIPDGGRGRVEFFRLPTGAPIVSRWWIRMPTALQLPGVGAPGTIRVTSLQEEGGIVLDEGGAPLGPDDGLLAQLEDGLGAAGAEAGGAPAPPEASDGVLDTVLADILARSRLSSETLVRGKVVDAMNGTGVVGATVVFLQGRSRYSAQTDEAGEFILAGIEEGPHRMTVRHLAFPTVEETIEVSGGGRATQVEVSLHREVVELSPIEVTVDRRPTFGALVPVYDRLELQRSLGLGRFWDRSEIEASGAFAITDVLRTLPGVSVLGSSITLNTLNPGCSRRSPLIYLDGVRFQTAGEPISTLVPLFQIEVLEVYRRASEVPGEYGGSDAQCGVIVIWTRRGG
jgi:hypothetical protein